jgi:hypothetical protein
VTSEEQRMLEIWKQYPIPVVFRPRGKQKLMLKIPYQYGSNFEWLRMDHRVRPVWNRQFKCWEVPRGWFEEIAARLLQRFSKLYVIQPYRTAEKCAPACWNALGLTCECSCMGEHHGSGQPPGKWHIVSETCAVSWHGRRYGSRLIEMPAAAAATASADEDDWIW